MVDEKCIVIVCGESKALQIETVEARHISLIKVLSTSSVSLRREFRTLTQQIHTNLIS